MAVVDDVQRLLDDTNVFWVDAHVYDALNQAQLELWADSRWDITTATVTLTASQASFGVPTSIFIPQRILRAGYEWYPTTYTALLRDNTDWRNTGVSTPRWFVNFDAETLIPYPKPSATIEFVVEGVAYPTEVEGTSTDITASTPLRKAIVYRAASRLAQNTRPQLGALWQAQSDVWLGKFRELQRNQFNQHLRRLRPGTVWTNAQMGELGDGRKIGGIE